MSKIKKLTPEVVSKIAAGQVVERPASVVKELIENAIDAKATDIEIELQGHGLISISVTDNGEGMSAEDLSLSFLPHTTSKVQSIEDLQIIKTLGFRGEALASIASVSVLSIESTLKGQELGYKVLVESGTRVSKVNTGRKIGTRVIVENIFENVPARLKFLKRPITELRLITEIVGMICLAYPDISFRLIHEGKTILDVSTEDVSERLAIVFGKSVENNVIPIKYESPYSSIGGLLSKPQLNVPNTQKLYVYVNKRAVHDLLTIQAIKEAYGTLLMTRTYPIGALFLTVPSELIDVNVHPTKQEVRFEHAQSLFLDIKTAVEQSLTEHNLTYYNVAFQGSNWSIVDELRRSVQSTEASQIGRHRNDSSLQIHNSYIAAESEKGLVIIDQHAAHESLLFFEFLKEWEKTKKSSIPKALVPPLEISLSPSQSIELREHQKDFQDIGFQINQTASNKFSIMKIPSIYTGEKHIEALIIEHLSIFSEAYRPKFTEKEHYMLATLACKSALKAGTELSDKTRMELLSQLTERNYAYTCPHGRPVKIEMSLGQLARMFKR